MFDSSELLSKEHNVWLFNPILHDRCKSFDWDLAVRGEVCSYGDLWDWIWTSIKILANLKCLDYQSSEARDKRNDFLIDYCKTSWKHSNETLLEEINPVVTETWVRIWEYIKIYTASWFWNYPVFDARNKMNEISIRSYSRSVNLSITTLTKEFKYVVT